MFVRYIKSSSYGLLLVMPKKRLNKKNARMRLDELAGAEIDGHGVAGGNDVGGEPGGLARDVGVLAEEQEQRLGEDEDGRHEDVHTGGDKDKPVDRWRQTPSMATWPAPKALAAERLERAAHAEEEAQCEGGEDGEAN